MLGLRDLRAGDVGRFLRLAPGGDDDLLHLHDLLRVRVAALGGDDDLLHLADFLAARDAVELLVGEFALVASAWLDMFVGSFR